MKLKKLLALTLALIMALSCMSITAFAANEYEFDSITLYKTEVSLVVGYKFGLTEKIHDKNQGNIPAGTVNVNWASSDETVATVSDDGTVTAVKSGTATVSAVPYGYEEDNTSGKTPLKATCTVTVVDAILDLETDATYSDTATVDQTYTATVNEPKTDKTKVQVSWKLEDITATVTQNKIWNTETLTWDNDGAATAVASPVTAEFDFVNLSSERVKGKVDFTASGDFNPTVDYSDKVVALLSKADDKDCDNTAEITVTLTPDEDDFTSLTANTNGTYGTYTVSIAKPEYLTFTATAADSSVTPNFLSGTWEYSTDNGNTWTAGTNDGNTAIALAQVNDFVELRGDGCTTGFDEQENPHFFSMSGKIAASGDATSITNGVGDDAKLSDYCYLCMFQYCTSLVEAPKLPATTLSDGCYWGMFQDCTSLTEAPILPATTLENDCYSCMFLGCTSLEEAPKLLSTTLANDCYAFMFQGCTSLKEAPELPATEMFACCYANMFALCTSLTQAPVLPATTLNESCYSQMFQGCTSLTTATILPATELAVGCYCYMFNGCTSLKVQVGGSAPANGGLIFVCPSNVEGSNYMFGGTDICDDLKGTFDEDDQLWYADFDITEGTAYYWYTVE